MDFTSSIPKYVYTKLTMSHGFYFSVNTIARTSLTDANDFYFAGKAINLSDGINTKTLPNATGYVMAGKTSDKTKSYFNFPSGYSLSLKNTCTINFVSVAFTVTVVNGGGIGSPSNPKYPTASSYN